jgi:hypothetical protein
MVETKCGELQGIILILRLSPRKHRRSYPGARMSLDVPPAAGT